MGWGQPSRLWASGLIAPEPLAEARCGPLTPSRSLSLPAPLLVLCRCVCRYIHANCALYAKAVYQTIEPKPNAMSSATTVCTHYHTPVPVHSRAVLTPG